MSLNCWQFVQFDYQANILPLHHSAFLLKLFKDTSIHSVDSVENVNS